MVLDAGGKQALLVLEDGSVFKGSAFAGDGEVLGEVVFNTGMTGYQEILTDPSYKGQIVAMTCPLIGNTGINPEDMESAAIHLEGFVVREYQAYASNWRSRESLKSFLERHGKLGVTGIDTRALTRRIRMAGAMRGILSTDTVDTGLLLERVRAYPGLVGRDLVKEVTSASPYLWKNGVRSWDLNRDGAEWKLSAASGGESSILNKKRNVPSCSLTPQQAAGGEPALAGGFTSQDLTPPARRVVVLDCGVKYNILRHLEQRGCEVIVLPANATGEEILNLSPAGVLLTNGPGDPAALPHIVEAVRTILGKVPIFGICLGHQILGQAAGGRTEKLKFGHHGLNQPIRDCRSGRVEITSQNHGFVVLPETLTCQCEKIMGNLNDDTSEGILYPTLRAFSVQHHPEAAPGPHDAAYLFDAFIRLMDEGRMPG